MIRLAPPGYLPSIKPMWIIPLSLGPGIVEDFFSILSPSSVPVLDIYPKEIYTYIHQNNEHRMLLVRILISATAEIQDINSSRFSPMTMTSGTAV